MTGPTQVLLWCVRAFVYGTVTLCGRPCHVKIPLTTHNPILESYNPARKIPTVWALPISLAATDGIDFSFSSSGYLDVSVHQVVTNQPMDSVCRSRDPGSLLVCQLPRAFRNFHALLTLNAGHPPCALCRLAAEIPNSEPELHPKVKPDPNRSFVGLSSNDITWRLKKCCKQHSINPCTESSSEFTCHPRA